MSTVDEQKRLVRAVCDGFKVRAEALPLSKRQQQIPADLPVRGPYLVSRTSLPKPPETSVIDYLYKVFNILKTHPSQEILSADCEPRDVRFEWLGRRLNVANRDEPEPDITNAAKYRQLAQATDPERTILHLHGGGFYAGNAPSWRVTPKQLARRTGYRIAAPSYRLAPQDPFPGALIDILITYLSLLSPAPGAFHSPVPASCIVLAGDSAGSNLALGLIQFLLTLRRTGYRSIPFNGRDVPLELPAGLTLFCSYMDISNAMPSWFSNGPNDILELLQPPLLPGFPPDELWPSNPPRGNPYCRETTLDHPLASPCACADWRGTPPIWFGAGSEERGVDGQRSVAARAHAQGVPVLWDEYDGLCHCFATILAKVPQSAHCYDAWADAARQFLDRAHVPSSRRRLMHMPDCRIELKDFGSLAPLPFETVRQRLRRKAEEHPPWLGRTAPPKL